MSSYNKLSSIIKENMPSSWVPMSIENLCVKIKLKDTDPEHLRLRLKMQGDFNKKTNNIYQIQNPILYEQFRLKVAENMCYGNIQIKELFHCTAESNVDSISMNNFDWRLCTRVKFGQGISFSTDPSYANLQSSLHNGIYRAMIVSDVIVGKKQIGNYNTVIPDNTFDTTVNDCETVYVKYCDNEFYPKYVIYYETYPVVSQNGHRMLVR